MSSAHYTTPGDFFKPLQRLGWGQHQRLDVHERPITSWTSPRRNVERSWRWNRTVMGHLLPGLDDAKVRNPE